MKKRHLIFIDGSGASAAGGKISDISNVFRLDSAFEWGRDVIQIFSYSSGVGTHGDRLSAWTGRGLDELIREVYINISSNYRRGDDLYVFGWSRGAAAARAVARMMSNIGLLSANRLHYLDEVWQAHLLQQLEMRRPAGLDEEDSTRLANYRANFADRLENPTPTIRFMGLFDTVAGNSWDRHHVFTKVNFDVEPLEPVVEVGVHLLSADDRRVPSFAPLLWQGKSRDDQVLEQIWMPGVHADIGGKAGQGYLSDLALITMVDRIRVHCPELHFDDGLFRKNLRDQFRCHRRVKISNECSGVSAVLSRSKRSIGKTDPASEYAHPLLSELDQQSVALRGAPKVYVNPAAHVQAAPEGEYAMEFRGIDPIRRPVAAPQVVQPADAAAQYHQPQAEAASHAR